MELPMTAPELVNLITTEAANAFWVTPEAIMGKTRTKSTADARLVSVTIYREITGHSLLETARAFGKKEHGTVKNAVRRVAELREVDMIFAKKYTKTREQVLKKLCLD